MTAPMPAGDGTPSEVTRLLQAAGRGEPAALERVVPLIYEELRLIARQRMGREDGHTLTPTAVVHEAYVRLAGQNGGWQDRSHFFAAASRAIRHVLVDHARRQSAAKRGGDDVPLPYEEGDAPVEPPSLDLLALDRALERLEARDPRLARVVECRFFAGLSVDETAQALDVSPRTAARDWRRARAYLLELLDGG